MQPDFYNAFCRHASDADLLLECKRWANADHLYGIAAECALKALLQIQGISFAENCTSSDRKYWVHINKLWDKYLSFMQTRDACEISDTNPFQNWDIAQRYAHEDDITEQTDREHCAAVDELRTVIEKARINGVLP